jgi:hypothetical protein
MHLPPSIETRAWRVGRGAVMKLEGVNNRDKPAKTPQNILNGKNKTTYGELRAVAKENTHTITPPTFTVTKLTMHQLLTFR